MFRVYKYLLSNFASTFLSLFGTLFFIVAITFFIRISRITAVVEVTFLELGKLFLFILPQIFLFTLPISFFIGLALSLFRLSKENETTVMFSLGLTPLKVAKMFGVLSILLTIILLINSLVLIPISNQLNTNFLDFKKSEAKLNLKPSKSGQNFSDWMVFVKNAQDINDTKVYNGFVLYQPKNAKGEKLVLSNDASVKNIDGELSLFLRDGHYYNLQKESVHKTKYSTMTLRSKSSNKFRQVNSILSYWSEVKTDERRAKNFSLYVLMSLLPLCTFLFAISFGIVTYRYQRNEIYGSIFATICIYFALTVVVSKYIPLSGIGIIFALFSLFSIEFFRYKILRVY